MIFEIKESDTKPREEKRVAISFERDEDGNVTLSGNGFSLCVFYVEGSFSLIKNGFKYCGIKLNDI